MTAASIPTPAAPANATAGATSANSQAPAAWSSAPTSAYPPISTYAVIGDMRTAALVGLNGSIDWCCLPEFPSASTFAAILDESRGGQFLTSTPRKNTKKKTEGGKEKSERSEHKDSPPPTLHHTST